MPNAGAGGVGGAGGASGGTDTSGEEPGNFPELTSPVEKVDLLLMVDNSVSMSDKQDILQLAIPDIVSRLVNPICVDAMGHPYPPAPPGQPCPEGQARELDAITDINVGIVSSSLGDAGANVACPGRGAQNYRADRVDMAHLVGSLERSTVQGDSAGGFLEWRAGSVDVDNFNANVQQMVRDVGEAGCGWESSLESWYRFLADPAPYRELTRVPCPGSSSAALNGVQPATDAEGRLQLDEVLLAQRAAFLRPGSLVVILMLTDDKCLFHSGRQRHPRAARRIRSVTRTPQAKRSRIVCARPRTA